MAPRVQRDPQALKPWLSNPTDSQSDRTDDSEQATYTSCRLPRSYGQSWTHDETESSNNSQVAKGDPIALLVFLTWTSTIVCVIAISEAAAVARYLHWTRCEERTFLDVGAHNGSTLAPFIHAGFQTVAVEPNPNLVEVIRSRFTCNQVQILDIAIHPTYSGTSQLYLDSRSDGASSLEGIGVATSTGSIDVDCLTPADFVARLGSTRFAVVKVDVEGLDAPVVHGLLDEGVCASVWIWEWHSDENGEHQAQDVDLLQRFLSQGYSVYQSSWWGSGTPGNSHAWRSLHKIPPVEESVRSRWGNFIALENPPNSVYWWGAIGSECSAGVLRYSWRRFRKIGNLYSRYKRPTSGPREEGTD